MAGYEAEAQVWGGARWDGASVRHVVCECGGVVCECEACCVGGCV